MRLHDNLRADHGKIMKLFVSWQYMLEKLNHEDRALLEDFEKCIDWVDVFVDRCHHGKEDEILFPAMASSEDPDVARLIKDLQAEHQIGRSLFESIKLEFRALSNPNGSPDLLVQLCRDYINLFKKHIRRENAQLLPQLEKCIPMEVQEQLVDQFERYQRKTMGPNPSIPG